MSWFFIAAVIALGFGGLSLVKARKARSTVGELLGVETSTTAYVRQMHEAAVGAAGVGAYRERIELEGTVAPGPGGPLSSEISTTECVWHRHKVTRHYEEVRRDNEGRRRTSKRKDKMVDTSTREPFILRDETGEIAVVPVNGIRHARKSVSEFREADRRNDSTDIRFGSFSLSLPRGNQGGGTLGYQYDEWVLAPGTRVFVSGDVVDRNGHLEVRAPEGGRLLISTRSEDELLASSRKEEKRNTTFGYGGLALGAVLALAGVVVWLV